MDVLLISARARRGHAVARQAEPATLARALVENGHRVRWIRPFVEGDGVNRDVPDAVQVIETRSAPPGPHSVGDHFVDVEVEIALNEALRDTPPDVVHVDGYGGAATYVVTWMSARMGVPCLVVAEPIEELLCHRGTLVHRDGSACDVWDDPERCADCCRDADFLEFGWWRRATAPLRRPFGILSPYPPPVEFLNRTDRVVHGLDCAQRVLLADGSSVDRLVDAGTPKRILCVGVPSADDVDAWVGHYRATIAGDVHT